MYNTPSFGSFGTNSTMFVAFKDFLTLDVPKCYYYYDTDYISAHTVNTAVSNNSGYLNLIQPNGSTSPSSTTA